MYGLLCKDAIYDNGLFHNFRLALCNYLGKESIKDILSIDDLQDITHLVIIDEHFIPCVQVWKNDAFIHILNERCIKTIVFNFEKIFNSKFHWNVNHQRKLETINNLTQFVSDINDAKILNTTIINKQLLSRDTVLDVIPVEKNNRILFIGQLNRDYPTRQHVIDSAISSGLPLDIIITNRKLTYTQFLQKLNEYSFILNPLGIGEFINVRFYEALKLGCTPIQQITPEMPNWYSELSNALLFTDFQNDITESVLSTAKSLPKKEMYLEDYFESINLSSYFVTAPVRIDTMTTTTTYTKTRNVPSNFSDTLVIQGTGTFKLVPLNIGGTEAYVYVKQV